MKPQTAGRIVLLALILIPLYLMIAIVYINRINRAKATLFEVEESSQKSQKTFNSQKAANSQKTIDPQNATVKINNDSNSNYDCAKDVKIGKKGQFKLIYIISVKGSGNTWTRQLLQSLTGFYAGGAYHEIKQEVDTDELYEQAPFPGEHFKPDSGRVLGIKTHSSNGVKRGDAAILVMRNPYDTMKAEFNRVMYQRQTGDGAGAHTASIDISLFRSDKWRQFVAHMAKTWSNFYKYVILETKKEKKNFHLLFFDALKIDKVAEMETLYDFLQDEAGKNFEVENVAERLKCIGEQNFDTFKREKQEIDFELFLEDEIEMINQFIIDYKQFFNRRKIKFPAEILDSWLRTTPVIFPSTLD